MTAVEKLNTMLFEEEPNSPEIITAFVDLVENNPGIILTIPDINTLTRDIRITSGKRLVARPEPDIYTIIQEDPYGRIWENERKRFNKRQFTLTIEQHEESSNATRGI